MKYSKKQVSVICVLFLCILGVFRSFSEEEISDNWFHIKSTTTLVSAQCIINGGDQDKDKTRKVVGIGEEIKLEAEGKALNDRNVVVEWELISGGDVATLEKDSRNTKLAKLTINADAKNNANVSVNAKAKRDQEEIATKKIDFEAKIPSAIKAKHSGMRVEGYPVDGDKINIGASSKLVLIIEPLSVSFANIGIREKAEDTEQDINDNWTGKHNTADVAATPDDRNEVKHDYIGIKGATVQKMQGDKKLGVASVWKCGWYTYSNNAFHCKISGQNYEQVFLITEDGLRSNTNLKEIKTSVSKFGAKTERTTGGNASHQDTYTP